MNSDNSENLIKFNITRTIPLILQAEMAECGLASMAMIASYYGHKLDLPAMRKRYSADLKGMNLQQLIESGDRLFEADIMLEQWTLIEWLLEPIYSLKGRVS